MSVPELPAVLSSRPRTSDETARRNIRTPSSPSKPGTATKLPDARASTASTRLPTAPSASSRSVSKDFRSKSWDFSCTKSFVSRSCARRGCLCDAPRMPPPFSRTAAVRSTRGRSSVPFDAAMTLDAEDRELLTEELDSLLSSREAGNTSPRKSPCLFHHSSVSGKVLEDLGIKEDGTPCWAEAAKRKKQFSSHPKTSIEDRRTRLDDLRRRRACEQRIQKQKEEKQRRFDELPQTERTLMSEAFYKFDLDNSGELDSDEVVQCLKEFGLSGMTGEETRAIIDICTDASEEDELPSVAWTSTREVAVGLLEFALTVIPRVRRTLQDMRTEALLRFFRVFDINQTGQISQEDCQQLSNDLGIDWSHFEECFKPEEHSEDEAEDDQSFYAPPLGPKFIFFEAFQSVVFSAREQATRQARCQERQIQDKRFLPEATFQEFRFDLLIFHELFERFDSDDNGSRDVEEVSYLLKDFGLLPQDRKEQKSVYRIMDACDEDGSGTFDFNEFLWLVHDIRHFAMERHKDELCLTFERYDRDGSGELSIAELSGLLSSLGLVPRTRKEQEELAHLIHYVDADGSGLIDFDEFQVLCQRIKEKMMRLRHEQMLLQVTNLGFTTQEAHEMKFVFDHLDTDQSGFIDKKEAKTGVLQKIRMRVSVEAFEEAFRQLNLDRAGELNYPEFADLMWRLREKEGQSADQKDEVFSWPDTK